MKRKLIIAALCIVSANIFSQTYKINTVYSDKFGLYLSHWKKLEIKDNNQIENFALWGYQNNSENKDNINTEVEYFNGNPKEVYLLLTQILKFTEKYQDEDEVITYISNVKLKTWCYAGYKLTKIYDKENKVFYKLNMKNLKEILDKFESYCDNQHINYK